MQPPPDDNQVWSIRSSFSATCQVDAHGNLSDEPDDEFIAAPGVADNDILLTMHFQVVPMLAAAEHTLQFVLAPFNTSVLLSWLNALLLVRPSHQAGIDEIVDAAYRRRVEVNGEAGWTLITPPAVVRPPLGPEGWTDPLIEDGVIVDHAPRYEWKDTLAEAAATGAGVFRVAELPFPHCDTETKPLLAELCSDLTFVPRHAVEDNLHMNDLDNLI